MSENDLNNQAAFIFRRAAGYIRNYGWQVSGMSVDGLPRCSMGALASAHKVSVWNKALAKHMYHSLYQELNGLTLTEFNYKHNDGEIVAELFDRASTRLSATKSLVPTS